jgi:hypothetical protein
MPRWALVLIVVSLALWISCAFLGYIVVWPWIKSVVSESQAAVTNEMAEAVFQSVSRRIAASDRAADSRTNAIELVLKEDDLNVNNAEVPGEVGIETGPNGARVYGVVTEIDPTGISMLLPGVTYTGIPVVEDDRIEMTRIDASNEFLGFALSAEMFEESLEHGINLALAGRELRPVSITLRHGAMTVRAEPVPHSRQSWRRGWSGGSRRLAHAPPLRAISATIPATFPFIEEGTSRRRMGSTAWRHPGGW